MKASRLVTTIGIALLAGTHAGPASAHHPYFSASATLSTDEHPAIELKLLHGDGLLFADPARAVVIDQNGELLAASPLSAALQLSCDDRHRQCLVYDYVTLDIYQPEEKDWQDKGLIEENGAPQRYPETIETDFGFITRPATISEIARFEAAGLGSSWGTTGFALAWWALFWLLLLTVAQSLFGKKKQVTIGSIVGLLARSVAALLMIPVAAYAWLLAPYSIFYLGFVVTVGAVAAILIAAWRSAPVTR